MSHFDHVMRLQDLDRKIEEAESEMKAILGHLKLDKIESLNDIPDAKLRARYDRLQLKVKDFKRLKKAVTGPIQAGNANTTALRPVSYGYPSFSGRRWNGSSRRRWPNTVMRST